MIDLTVLGTTNSLVSKICLGTMHFGNLVSVPIAYELLDRYVACSGNFLDTANIYSFWIPGYQGGESEETLGQWMRLRKNRNRLFIATKVGFAYPGTRKGLRAEQIIAECEKSLRRLGVETIDLYYAHGDDKNTPLEETLAAFNRVKEMGKVRYIGASNYYSWRLEESRAVSRTHGYAEYNCVQQRYSYVRPAHGAIFDYHQLHASTELINYCQDRGLSLLAYSPLLNGAYTRQDRTFPDQYQTADTEARMKTLKQVANEVNATVNQVVLAWMMQSTPPIIPVIGTSTNQQLDENLGSSLVKLSQEQWKRLTESVR